MPSLIELTTQLVTAQTTSAAMSTEEIVASLTKIHSTLGQLEGGCAPVNPGRVAIEPKLSVEKSFKKTEIVCMICGKGFKALARHLDTAHGMKAKEYRKQFAIPENQPLTSKLLSDTLKEHAQKMKESKKVNSKSSESIALSHTKNTSAPSILKKKVGRPRKTPEVIPAV